MASLSLPWKTRIAIKLTEIGFDLIIKKDGTLNQSLLKFIGIRTSPSLSIGVKTHDVELPVMVFFHGGGFIVLNPAVKKYDDVCRKFARELPVIVVSVEYSLAPEYRHHSQHDDGFDVLKFLDIEENRSKWLPENASISRCFIGGDSAGGHITHYVAERASQFNFQLLKVRYPCPGLNLRSPQLGYPTLA
ncbi:putative carboxylesterase [Helianthus anomalus]